VRNEAKAAEAACERHFARLWNDVPKISLKPASDAGIQKL
jgi:hypothetical protein